MIHPSTPTSSHTNAPASRVSQRLWLLCSTKMRWGGEERAQIILQNRKTKETESAPKEGMREAMSNARRLLHSKQGKERKRKSKWSERQREWQRMYLSRSQIINRDSAVWIERKRQESGGREREHENVGKWGWADWSDGEGPLRAGVEVEGRWRNVEWQTGRWTKDNTVEKCQSYTLAVLTLSKWSGFMPLKCVVMQTQKVFEILKNDEETLQDKLHKCCFFSSLLVHSCGALMWLRST